jgi:diguanylate cyclase
MLEFPEALPQAVTHLKRIVPALSKLRLPPNPLNYALWYVHVSGRRPELSAVIDKVERGLTSYDDEIAQALFRNHVCLHSAENIEKAAARFHLIATALHEHLQQSIDSSTRIDKNISSSRQTLQAALNSRDVAATVSSVTALLDTFTEANREYRRTMQNADEEINRLRIELERTQQSANIDELTRLYNRAAFYRELNRRIRDRAATQKLCIVLCDLDYFKLINDRFGHLMGDRVLQRIGALLLEKSRDGTLAARYGGEEFALILLDTDLDDATLFAERLRNAILQLRIKIRNSDTVLERLTASFGIARIRDGDTAEALFERADKALYAAKEAGRNTTMLEV